MPQRFSEIETRGVKLKCAAVLRLNSRNNRNSPPAPKEGQT